MKQEVTKIMRMIDEIGTYFLHNYAATRFDVHLERRDDAFQARCIVSPVAIEQGAYDELERWLKQKRNPEIEEYYWQLTGEAEDSSELALVAMMSDVIDMEYDGEVLTIDMTRKI